jgi:hypothetical protein
VQPGSGPPNGVPLDVLVDLRLPHAGGPKFSPKWQNFRAAKSGSKVFPDCLSNGSKPWPISTFGASSTFFEATERPLKSSIMFAFVTSCGRCKFQVSGGRVLPL